MKKSFKVLCLMLVAFMMSGCMKFNMNMDINSDKSMNLELIVAFANEMMGSSNETNMDNSEIQKLKDNGFNVEDIETLIYIGQNSHLDISGLLFSGILIASLGAVIDTAMSIATTIEEIKYRRPDISAKELLKSGIKIGGDMMGTMSNTLILAFTGGSLSTLVVFYAYDMPFLQMFNSYSIGIEIIQGISGSLGVILTVPFVSIISAFLMTRKKVSLNNELK